MLDKRNCCFGAPAPNGGLDEVLVLQRGDVQEGVVHERLQAEVGDLVRAVGDLACGQGGGASCVQGAEPEHPRVVSGTLDPVR